MTDDRGANLFEALHSRHLSEGQDLPPFGGDVDDAAAADDAEDFELERDLDAAAEEEASSEHPDLPAGSATLGAVLAAIDDGLSEGALSAGDAAYLRRCAVDGCASRAAVVEAFEADAKAAALSAETAAVVSAWLMRPRADAAEAVLGVVASLCPRFYAVAEALLGAEETGDEQALNDAMTEAFHAALLAHEPVDAAFVAHCLSAAPPPLRDGAEQPEPESAEQAALYRRHAAYG